MALSGGAIPVGATYSPSGGTSRTLVSLGQPVAGRLELFIDDSPATLQVRKNVFVSVVQPKVNTGSPDGYTQMRTTVEFHVPFTTAGGTVTTNKVTITVSQSVESDAAMKTLLRELIAHVGVDADFSGLITSGSLA